MGQSMAREGQSRRGVADDQASPARHICIVTGNLIDNGPLLETAGSITGLARALVAGGNRVTVLFVPEYGTVSEGGATFLKNHFYDTHLVELEVLTEARDLLPGLTYPQKKSVAVYYTICERSFDIVYFALEGGLAFYPLVACDTGVYANPPQMVVLAQSPLLWLSEADRFFLATIDQLSIHHMEKMSLALADNVVCASEALRAWFVSKGWQLPDRTEVLEAPLPLEWTVPIQRPDETEGEVRPREIALLSLWNFRDGLTLACDMLDQLAKQELPPLAVTGFGWFGRILGEHTGGMLLRRGRRWPFALKLFPHASVRQMIQYCVNNNVLAVIPAWASCSGFWVRACLDAGISFVTTDVGANAEAVPPDKRSTHVAPADAKALATRVREALARPARSVREPPGLQTQWIDHAERTTRPEKKTARRKSADEPLVTIVCVHHERPHTLTQALAAIEQQTYANIEVILVDDGSTSTGARNLITRLKPSFKERGWTIIEQENKYLGAARNVGIKAARGDYVLFVDDDNALFRDAVRTFVGAMEASEADICTAFHKVFYDDAIPLSEKLNRVHYLPLGGSVDLGLVLDSFGDANAMVRRSVFEKIGLQYDAYGYTANDWEFFARAELAGLKLRVIPEPLYWYRSSTQGMYRGSHWYDNRLPVLETYRKANFKGLDVFYHLALAAFSPESEINSLKENLRQSESDQLYLRLAESDPNSAETITLLSEIAAGEGRPDTALTLLGAVRHPAFRPTAEDRLSTAPLRGDGYRDLTAGVQFSASIDFDDLRRFEAQVIERADIVPLSYLEEPNAFFLQATQGLTSLAALAACCPSETVSIRAMVCMDQELAKPGEAMLLLVPLHQDPAVAVSSAAAKAAPGCSGWVSVPYGYLDVELSALFASATKGPMTLVVAVRAPAGSTDPVLMKFSAIAVTTSAADRMARRPRLGAPPSKLRSRRLWPAEYERAELLTHYPSTLPQLLFDSDAGGIFMRPSDQGPVIAIIRGGLPALARGILARVEVAHEEAPPFEFALALCEPTERMTWIDGQPSESHAFSGWITVSDTFTLVDVEARVQRFSKSKLDIVLAVRVPPGSRPTPANTFWRHFIILWDE